MTSTYVDSGVLIAANRSSDGIGVALHLAVAIGLGAEEFATAERQGKPMFRVPGIRVLSLRPARAR